MKRNISIYIRCILPGALLLVIGLCRFFPAWGEAYARSIYPTSSLVLSAFASLFPFSLEEVFVVFALLLLVIYPVWGRWKKKSWRSLIGGEVEKIVWVYIWFYLGWGLNYFRSDIYQRAEVAPAAYNEAHFHRFLTAYTDSLNHSYLPHLTIDKGEMSRDIKESYTHVPVRYGLTRPQAYQHPKQLMFNSLYSSVGVLGYMGPFFAEYQLNEELLPVQVPFSYAHELSHLLGVSNEAEANYWAYQVCTRSALPAVRYSGYFGLLPYVLVNASFLLSEAEFETWLKTLRPEVVEAYQQKAEYWGERYSPFIGEVQKQLYNLFLKGNNIPSGRKNYAEVIGILLSLESY